MILFPEACAQRMCMKATMLTLFSSNRQRKVSSKLVNLIQLLNTKLKLETVFWFYSKIMSFLG
jgi:hypothetical protein